MIPVILTDQQVNQLLEYLARQRFALRNYCMVYLMLIHGLRIKELIDLQLVDVDLYLDSLRIRRSARGFDDIHPLMEHERRLLEAWLVQRDLLAEQPSGALFIARHGQAWSRKGILKLFTQISQQLGFTVTNNILINTSREQLHNLPLRESEVHMYMGRATNTLSFIKKQQIQQAFRGWYHGFALALNSISY